MGTQGPPGCRRRSQLPGKRAAPAGDAGLRVLRVQADATAGGRGRRQDSSCTGVLCFPAEPHRKTAMPLKLPSRRLRWARVVVPEQTSRQEPGAHGGPGPCTSEPTCTTTCSGEPRRAAGGAPAWPVPTSPAACLWCLHISTRTATCLHQSHETCDRPRVAIHSTHVGTVQTALARPDSAAAPRCALRKDEHGKTQYKGFI